MEVSDYPVRIMVWGAIGKGFKSPLIRVTKTLTAPECQALLAPAEAIEMLNQRSGSFAYAFQQDGARPHTAKATIAFLKERVELIPVRILLTPNSMFTEASRIWDEISIDAVNNLIRWRPPSSPLD